MLLPMGFEILTPGQISFREPAELLAQARMIVAPHGSAFMNLIFAPKDCMVIDLMSDTWIDLPEHTWIYRLTSLMQLRYAVILGEVTWTGHRDRYAEGVVFPDIPLTIILMSKKLNGPFCLRSSTARGKWRLDGTTF